MSIGRIKIRCHSCHGTGVLPEKAYPSGKQVMVICYECSGSKFVYADVQA